MYSIGYISSLLRAYVLLGIHTSSDLGVIYLLRFLKLGSGNFLPGSPKVIDELMGQPGFGIDQHSG